MAGWMKCPLPPPPPPTPGAPPQTPSPARPSLPHQTPLPRRTPLKTAWLVEDKDDKEELMNKEELTISDTTRDFTLQLPWALLLILSATATNYCCDECTGYEWTRRVNNQKYSTNKRSVYFHVCLRSEIQKKCSRINFSLKSSEYSGTSSCSPSFLAYVFCDAHSQTIKSILLLCPKTGTNSLSDRQKHFFQHQPSPSDFWSTSAKDVHQLTSIETRIVGWIFHGLCVRDKMTSLSDEKLLIKMREREERKQQKITVWWSQANREGGWDAKERKEKERMRQRSMSRKWESFVRNSIFESFLDNIGILCAIGPFPLRFWTNQRMTETLRSEILFSHEDTSVSLSWDSESIEGVEVVISVDRWGVLPLLYHLHSVPCKNIHKEETWMTALRVCEKYGWWPSCHMISTVTSVECGVLVKTDRTSIPPL